MNDWTPCVEGIERRQDRRPGGLGPGRLGDAVVEDRPLRGHARERRGGGPRVSVERKVIAPQRVHPYQDHALRACRCAAPARFPLFRNRTDDGGAPEAERARRVGGQGEGQRHVAAAQACQVHGRGLPAIGQGHGALEQDVVHLAPALAGLHAESHRRGLDRPHRQLQPRARGQVQIEAQRVGSARDQGLAIDLRHPVPGEAGADAGEVLVPGHDAHGLDLEGGTSSIRGTKKDVPRRGRKGRCRAEHIGAHLVARDQRAAEGPRDDRDDLCFRLQIDLVDVADEHGQVGAARRAHADLHFVHDVAVLGRRPLEVDHGSVGGGATREAPVAEGQPLDSGPRDPGGRLRGGTRSQ